MKLLLSLQIFFLVCLQSFSQSGDTLKIPGNSYKNNIQTNLLGVLGYFGLQYERALSKDWSISLIGTYRFPFKQLSQSVSPGMVNVYTEHYSLQSEVRYYLDKNEINNNGLYLGIDAGFAYVRDYVAHYKNRDYSLKKYPWFGATAGYQLLIKKRLVLDAGIGIHYGIKGDLYIAERGWSKMRKSEIFIPVTLNIGYAF